jgi:hypothetical protein
MDQSIPERVTAILSELGLAAPTNFIQTMLMKDGYFVGWKFRYDGGYAIFQPGGNAVESYDEKGTLLTTAVVGGENRSSVPTPTPQKPAETVLQRMTA